MFMHLILSEVFCFIGGLKFVVVVGPKYS